MSMFQFLDGLPIYQQIAGELKRRLICGQLVPGAKLPSVREIAEEFKVNPNTVQRVYMELEKEGLTYTERGVGTFLREDSFMVDRLKQEEAVKLRARFITEAKKLGLGLDEVIRDIKQEWIGGEKND